MSHYIDSIKLIFIHIPKTGGTFLENKLQSLAADEYNEYRRMSSHYTINEYLNKIDKYIVFGVVRNPYDRIMSAYNMFVRKSWSGVIKNTYIKLNKPKTFETFIQNLYILFKNNELPWQNVSNTDLDKVCSSSNNFAVHIIPQYYYFINYDNQIGIKKENILKYESLDNDIMIFLNNNYKDNKIVKRYFQNNIINDVKIKKTYDIPMIYPKLINMIYEIYENDFVYFDY